MKKLLAGTALLMLVACASSDDPSHPEQSQGRPQGADATRGASTEGSGSLMCDCAALIPIKYRPDFPKVGDDDAPGCRYLGSDMDARELRVGVNAGVHDQQYQETRARWQSKFVKIHDSYSKVLDDGGQAMIAVASDDLGLTRFTVAEFAQTGYIVSVAEALKENAASAPPPGFPTYLDGLQTGLGSACGGG